MKCCQERKRESIIRKINRLNTIIDPERLRINVGKGEYFKSTDQNINRKEIEKERERRRRG